MKDGFIIKSAKDSRVTKEDLEIINKFTRRKFSEEEIYVFSLVLCDNEIDRDNEKFTPDSLEKLSKLFVGSTGILNHDTKSENQTARIFKCKREEVKGRKNKLGEPYFRVVAKAYMPRLKKNQDFITSIDSGITKEVSVGCSVENVICSICQKDMRRVGCEHQKGKYYKRSGLMSLCYAILDNPTDAYEWSFVAVPSQKEAGVIKGYVPYMNGGDKNMEDIIKNLSLGKEISLNEKQSQALYNTIVTLKEEAEAGKEYKMHLKNDVLKLSIILDPSMTGVMKNIVERLSIEELKCFRKAYKEKYSKISPAKPQLGQIEKNMELEKLNNTQFKI